MNYAKISARDTEVEPRRGRGRGGGVGRGVNRRGGGRGGRRQSPTVTPPPQETNKTILGPPDGIESLKNQVNANGIGFAGTTTTNRTQKTEETNSVCDKAEVFCSFFYLCFGILVLLSSSVE